MEKTRFDFEENKSKNPIRFDGMAVDGKEKREDEKKKKKRRRKKRVVEASSLLPS
jgi:hypothetical protein